MNTNWRQTKLTLLMALVALSGLTVYAYRASEQWRGHSAAARIGPQGLLTAENAEATVEPAQSGGSYNITQSVIAGGGGASSGGSYAENGVIGQSAVGASSGGQYSVEGGFLVGGQSGGCPVILVSPSTLPDGEWRSPSHPDAQRVGKHRRCSAALPSASPSTGRI